MQAKSAFGTQADRNDYKIEQSLAGTIIGLAACMMASFGNGPSAQTYDLSADLVTNAHVTAPMTSISTLGR